MIISLEGLDKAAVLAALYNASHPLGMGFLHFDPKPMTTEEAKRLLEENPHFDYLKGRVMKLDLSGNGLNSRLYDRDVGSGTANVVITALRKTGDPNCDQIRNMHLRGLEISILLAKHSIKRPSRTYQTGGLTVVELGLGDKDIASKLGPAIDEAEKHL